VKDEKLFSESVVEEIRVKIQNKGLEGVDTKELLVLVADYFNDRMGNIQKIGHGALGALWAIFAGIIASLIAGLIIALLTLK